MPLCTLHCIRSIAIVLAFSMFTGCWQEIEYQPTADSGDARRRPRREAVKEIPETQPVETAPTEEPSLETASTAPSNDGAQIAVNGNEIPSASITSQSPAHELTPPTANTPESIASQDRGSAPVADTGDPDSEVAGNTDDVPDFIRNEAAAESPPPEEPSSEEIVTPEIFPTDPAKDQPPVVVSEPEPPLATAEPPPNDGNATLLASWQLGSKLSLAALAHDRGLVPEDVAKWLQEARAAAESLGTSFTDLPLPESQREASSPTVHDYLAQQGQQIWRDLNTSFGPEHAALFEIAVKSNVLLVLYQPESTAAELLANSIQQAGPLAKLPPELLQPLLDSLTKHAPAAEVRNTVRRLHTEVEKHFSSSVGQAP
jgi:hypothetical protein